jgi:hypothetical protein
MAIAIVAHASEDLVNLEPSASDGVTDVDLVDTCTNALTSLMTKHRRVMKKNDELNAMNYPGGSEELGEERRAYGKELMSFYKKATALAASIEGKSAALAAKSETEDIEELDDMGEEGRRGTYKSPTGNTTSPVEPAPTGNTTSPVSTTPSPTTPAPVTVGKHTSAILNTCVANIGKVAQQAKTAFDDCGPDCETIHSTAEAPATPAPAPEDPAPTGNSTGNGTAESIMLENQM